MDMISTELFRISTPADHDTVWRVLTRRADGPGFYGLTVDTDWRVGSPVQLHADEGLAIMGEVLAVEAGVRLSHTLGDRTDEASVFVTWVLEPDGSGTLVRLYVDEVGPGAGPASEIAAAWRPVLAAFEEELARCHP
jgi:uncharacterized protein YndB with AHSA1/START domain